LKRYEGMFLFDSAALHQWSEMEAEVRRLCDRIQADLQVCVNFDERKLAYEIKGRRRGTYVLTYFDADPSRIGELERDVQLSEVILRVLVLRAEKITEARIAELKAHPAGQPLQPISSDGRRGDGGGHRGRYDTRSQSDAKAQASKQDKAEPEKPKDADAPAEAAGATAVASEPQAKPSAAAESAPDADKPSETPREKPADE
jgi:small subunit ribosomal protein S6